MTFFTFCLFLPLLQVQRLKEKVADFRLLGPGCVNPTRSKASLHASAPALYICHPRCWFQICERRAKMDQTWLYSYAAKTWSALSAGRGFGPACLFFAHPKVAGWQLPAKVLGCISWKKIAWIWWLCLRFLSFVWLRYFLIFSRRCSPHAPWSNADEMSGSHQWKKTNGKFYFDLFWFSLSMFSWRHSSHDTQPNFMEIFPKKLCNGELWFLYCKFHSCIAHSPLVFWFRYIGGAFHASTCKQDRQMTIATRMRQFSSGLQIMWQNGYQGLLHAPSEDRWCSYSMMIHDVLVALFHGTFHG